MRKNPISEIGWANEVSLGVLGNRQLRTLSIPKNSPTSSSRELLFLLLSGLPVADLSAELRSDLVSSSLLTQDIAPLYGGERTHYVEAGQWEPISSDGYSDFTNSWTKVKETSVPSHLASVIKQLRQNIARVTPSKSMREFHLENIPSETRFLLLLTELNRQAIQNREFGAESVALKALIEENLVAAEEYLRQANLTSWHGRVRWLLAEAVADQDPGSEIQTFLLDRLRSESDSWMLFGSATLLRGIRLTDSNRTEALKILRNRLGEALENEKPYRESVRARALGDMLLLAGSLAEVADIPLLGRFPLADRDIKPRANAFEALKHVLRRHPESREAGEFFEKHLDQLDNLGRFLAENRSLGSTHGVLLQSLIGLLAARLSSETEVAVRLAETHSYALNPTRNAILDSKKAFSKLNAEDWLAERESSVKEWLDRLQDGLDKKRRR